VVTAWTDSSIVERRLRRSTTSAPAPTEMGIGTASGSSRHWHVGSRVRHRRDASGEPNVTRDSTELIVAGTVTHARGALSAAGLTGLRPGHLAASTGGRPG